MKVVIVNASHRKDGATAKVLNEFASQLKRSATEISMFHVSDLDIAFCKGCCSCYKTGECFIADDAEKLSQVISSADAIVIGTPCYVSGVSGQLKTLIDRGHFVIEQLLKGKHAIGVVTYENAGGGSAYNYLKNLFASSGAKTVEKLIVKTDFDSDPIKNSKLKTKIKKKATKLCNSIQNSKSSLVCSIINFLVLNVGIKPFVLRKGVAYQGVLNHWKEKGISYE